MNYILVFARAKSQFPTAWRGTPLRDILLTPMRGAHVGGAPLGSTSLITTPLKVPLIAPFWTGASLIGSISSLEDQSACRWRMSSAWYIGWSSSHN